MLVRVGSLRATRQNGGPLRLADGTVAALDLQLANGSAYINGASVSLASVVACSRAATGYAETASGLLVPFATDTLRRTDKGLLSELASTNVINSSLTGVGVGTNTMPTGWTANNPIDSLTRTLIETGTQDGRPYLDVRWNGTSGSAGTTTTLSFNSVVSTAALNAETWTGSIDAALVGGSLTNVSSMVLTVRFNDAGGTSLTSSNVSILGVAATRTPYEVTATASNASTAWVNMTIVTNFNNTSAVDFTLRFYVPQLEKSPVRTSPIIGAANTLRSADVITMTGTNFSDIGFDVAGGTFLIKGRWRGVSGVASSLFAVSDGTNTNRILLNCTTTGIVGVFVDGGAATGRANSITLGAEAAFTAAVRHQANNVAISCNGGAVTTDSTVDMPTGVNRLYVGAGPIGTGQPGTPIERLAWVPSVLSDAEMIAAQALL